MKVVVIGLGLIGGSFAINIKALYEDALVLGIDNIEEHISKARELGLISAEGSYSELGEADIVIVAVPVNATLEILPEVLNLVGNQTLVFDVGSSKELICSRIREHSMRRNYLATHPVAGTEFSGPSAAFKELFRGKTNIICEIERTAFKIQERALKLFFDLGMRIRYMNPKAHDKHIAYVSHLSHISSFMLGKTVMEEEKNERDIFDMAGSGFESTVRLAKSSPAMWTPIFEQNNSNIIKALEEYIANLQGFRDLMLNKNYSELFKKLENANKIKEILEGTYAIAPVQ